MDWIAVGLKEDVPPGTVIPSRIDDTDLAVWCSPSGKFHAWSDRCPHRGMRLSHGFVRGDTLACIYHGWQYSEDGTCHYIPAHPQLAPPKTICVPRFACEEAGGVLWASLHETSSRPPVLAGHRPVRSMPIARSAGEIAAQFGSRNEHLIEVGAEYDVILALQPCGPDLCMAHALAGSECDPREVSHWLERLRTALEEGET